MESQGDAPQNVQVHPNNEFLQYMQINADFMNGLSRQLDTSDVVSRIHNFSGNNPSSFRLWMKHLRREALEKQPIDDQYMRKLVSRTVKESAADFWYEIRVARPNITWEEIQDVFRERFANYVDAQIALQKLSKLKQDHQQTLHSFAQKITETAREAYSEADYATAIVTRQLRDIFINGLRCHRTSQLLIREQIVDLPTALNIAVRQDLLRQTYKLREVDKIDGEGRHVESMDIDTVERDDHNNENAPATIKDIRELSENIAAIASNFKKAQGQYNTEHNIGQQNKMTKHNFMTHNSDMQQNNKNINVNPRNRYYTKHDRPLLGPGEHQQNLVQPQGNYRAFVPRNRYQGYPDKRPYSEPIPKYLNRPRPDDKNRPDTTIVFEGHRKPLQWTPEGKPICVHCEIVGHVRRQCWKLHPDLRPQNNQAHQFTGASGN